MVDGRQLGPADRPWGRPGDGRGRNAIGVGWQAGPCPLTEEVSRTAGPGRRRSGTGPDPPPEARSWLAPGDTSRAVAMGSRGREMAQRGAFIPVFVQPKAPPANALHSRWHGADALKGHPSALNTGCRAMHNRARCTDNTVCPLPL